MIEILFAAIATVLAMRFISNATIRYLFRKDPVGERCRVDMGGRFEKGTVLNQSSLVDDEFMVKLDSGRYYVADREELKPVYWEI